MLKESGIHISKSDVESRTARPLITLNGEEFTVLPEDIQLALYQEERGRNSETRVAKALRKLPLVQSVKLSNPWGYQDRKGKDAFVLFKDNTIVSLQVKSSEWGINKYREQCSYINNISLQEVSDYLIQHRIVILNGQDDPKEIRRKFLFYLEKMKVQPKIQMLKEGFKYKEFAIGYLKKQGNDSIWETGRVFGKTGSFYCLITVGENNTQDYIVGLGSQIYYAKEDAAYEFCMKYNVPIPSEAIEVSTDDFKNDFVTEDDMDIDLWGDLETAETSPTS